MTSRHARFIGLAGFALAMVSVPTDALQDALAPGEDAGIAQIFAQHDLNGTIVIASTSSNQRFIHNDPRATREFSPASTFKILNTLIALEEGVANNKDEMFIWDGAQHSIKVWNRNHSLRSAFRVSCVWCYQSLARKIGVEQYRNYLTLSEYGNLDSSLKVTEFWLDGSLSISAVEQVDFMTRVVNRELPFTGPTYDALHSMMLMETTTSHNLHLKTGWTGSQSSPPVGWIVGYVQTRDDSWVFALNVDVEKVSKMSLLPGVIKDIFRKKGIV